MKESQYALLVAARKACRGCPRLQNPAAVDGGVHDCDRIGPYSLWQGNLDAPVMVVGQDFADVTTYRERRGWPNPKAGTNEVLVRLARAAGFELRSPRDGEHDDQLFFTNAVLCLKEGGMQAPIPPAAVRNCAERFLRPTIELARPRAIVTLGRAALHAVLHAFELPRPRRFLDVVAARGADRARLRPLALPDVPSQPDGAEHDSIRGPAERGLGRARALARAARRDLWPETRRLTPPDRQKPEGRFGTSIEGRLALVRASDR